MKIHRTQVVISALIFIIMPIQICLGAVAEFTDRASWDAAVGDVTTFDFTGFPLNTFITDQFIDQGVSFSDGDDVVRFSPGLFRDEWGLDGNFFGNDDITIDFTTPQFYIAVDYPGAIRFDLYRESVLFYSSANSAFPLGGIGNFAGVLSTELFDRVVLIDWASKVATIDDLHFGVPGPGALPVLALGVLGLSRRRKRKHDGST